MKLLAAFLPYICSMKKYLILSIVFLTFCSFSQIVYQKSIADAFRIARQQNKIVFLKYYAETCSHCQDLQRALDNDSVSTFFNNNFISCKYNAEEFSEADQKFLATYNFNLDQTPIMFFFDNDQKFIHYATPKQEVPSVYNVGKKALSPTDRATYLPLRYRNGERDPIMLKYYSKYTQLMGEDSMTKLIAEDLFTLTPENELLSQSSLVATAKYVKSIDNSFFKFWMDHFDKLDSISPNFTMEEKRKVFTDILSNDITKNISNWSLEKIQRAKRYIVITGLNSNKNIFTWERELYLLNQSSKDVARNFLNELISETKDNKYLATYTLDYFFNISTVKEDYETLLNLLEDFPKENPIDIETTLLCLKMKCYSKLKQEQKFKQVKTTYIELCKKNGIEVKKECLSY